MGEAGDLRPLAGAPADDARDEAGDRAHADLDAEVVAAVVEAGRRLRGLAGRLPDVGGARKEFLTTEDLRIERDLTDLVARRTPGARVWGEELSGPVPDLAALDDAWVLDPVSSTETLLRGLPHYAVVAARLRRGRPVFAVVYDPSVDELFTARAGGGARLGGQRLRVSTTATGEPPPPARTRLVAPLARPLVGTPEAARWWAALAPYDVVRPLASFAVSYAWVAAGRYDGVLARTKDAFAEFAGWLLVTEAGGSFRGGGGGDPTAQDRWFYGGGPAVLPLLGDLATSLQLPPDPTPPGADHP